MNNDRSIAELETDVAALARKLGDVESELKSVEAGTGQDYRSLLDGSGDLQGKLERLTLQQRALKAGLRGAEQAVEASKEARRVQGALELRERLHEALAARCESARELVRAVDTVADAMNRIIDQGIDAIRMTSQVPDAVLGAHGWMVADGAGGMVATEELRHLVQIALAVRLGEAWPYDRLPTQGFRVNLADRIALGSAQMLNRFDAHHRIGTLAPPTDQDLARLMADLPGPAPAPPQDDEEEMAMQREMAAWRRAKAGEVDADVDEQEGAEQA